MQKQRIGNQHEKESAIQAPLARDQLIRAILALGKKRWKEKTRYHRRSLVETAMFRFKQLFTSALRARSFINQAHELFIKCNILNRFTQLDLPHSLVQAT